MHEVVFAKPRIKAEFGSEAQCSHSPWSEAASSPPAQLGTPPDSFCSLTWPITVAALLTRGRSGLLAFRSPERFNKVIIEEKQKLCWAYIEALNISLTHFLFITYLFTLMSNLGM